MTMAKTVGLSFVLCLGLLHGYVAALNCTSPTPESLISSLNNEVFSKKGLRPIKNLNDAVNVSVYVTLVGIFGVDAKRQSLTVGLWQVLQWNIYGLSWDKKECGTERISVPRSELWTPDVQISEFVDEDKAPQTPYVYLYNNGDVYDDRPVRAVTACQLEIYTFPFDVQNCSMTFRPYLHLESDIRVTYSGTAQQTLEESKQVIETKGEWELVDIQIATTTLELAEGRYSEIKLFIILRRMSVLYVVNLLIPSSFLIAVDLFSFLLPPASVDRSTFKMTLILGYTVFLLLMNDLLPVTGNTTPLINVFFSISLALMVASLLETIFITNIQFSSSQYSTVPKWLSILVLRYLAIIVCIPPMKNTNRVTVSLGAPVREIVPSSDVQSGSGNPPSENQSMEVLRKLSRDLTAIRKHIDAESEGSKASQEWKMIGVVFDRLLFALYIIFITASFITIVLLWSGLFSHIDSGI